MPSTFTPGDHLQVRRKLGYNHHGIYINDDRVIQFGGGIFDKPHAAIEAVPLKTSSRVSTDDPALIFRPIGKSGKSTDSPRRPHRRLVIEGTIQL